MKGCDNLEGGHHEDLYTAPPAGLAMHALSERGIIVSSDRTQYPYRQGYPGKDRGRTDRKTRWKHVRVQ